MNNLETFISGRIAHEEALHYVALAHGSADEKERAARWIAECETKRWILDFYRKAGHSGDSTAPAAWATLTQVLFKIAAQWRDHPDHNPAWTPAEGEPETFAERSKRLAVKA